MESPEKISLKPGVIANVIAGEDYRGALGLDKATAAKTSPGIAEDVEILPSTSEGEMNNETPTEAITTPAQITEVAEVSEAPETQEQTQAENVVVPADEEVVMRPPNPEE